MELIKISNRIIDIGTKNIRNPETVKRIRLCNLMAVTVFTTGTPFAFIFYFYGSKISGLLLMVYIMTFLIILKLNDLRKHTSAKFLMLILMNTAVIHYSLWYGVESGLHLMLVPFACVPFLIFSKDYLGYIIFFVSTSFIGFMVIELIDYAPYLMLDPGALAVISHGITLIFWTWIILVMLYLSNQNALAFNTLSEQKKEQTTAIVNAQENERKRIARDLHDSFGQLLSALKINLEMIPDKQNIHLSKALEITENSLREMKNIAQNLMPATLENSGLEAALSELVERLRHTGKFKIYFYVKDVDQNSISKNLQFNVFRIVQEALSNIIKHAEATEINLQLLSDNYKLTIIVEDNGKGFDFKNNAKEGRGLQNIQARTEWLDGTLNIDSGENIGTTLIIEMPLHAVQLVNFHHNKNSF